jgi:ferrous iron transport protein A
MIMMLTFAPENRELWIQRIKGKDEVKKFLSNLGFVEGAKIIVINQVNGNLIVNVKDTRVAIGRELSNRVMVCYKEG